MLKPEQIRAARSLLGWSARELAERSDLNLRTIQRIENGHGQLRGHARTIEKIHKTLTAAGIGFIEGDTGIGVVQRKRPGK